MVSQRTRAALAVIGLVTAAVGFAGTAAAAPVNLGFETGSLSGWTVSGQTSLAIATTSADVLGAYGSTGTWSAAQGQYFALLSTGGGTNLATKLSQTFTAAANEALSMRVFFDTSDYSPYNDDATVVLTNLTTGSTSELYRQDVVGVGNFGETPWVTVGHTIQMAGSYRLEFAVTNRRDNKRVSYFGIDAGPSVVPMPSAAWLAMAGGLLWVGVRVRREKAAGWAE